MDAWSHHHPMSPSHRVIHSISGVWNSIFRKSTLGTERMDGMALGSQNLNERTYIHVLWNLGASSGCCRSDGIKSLTLERDHLVEFRLHQDQLLSLGTWNRPDKSGCLKGGCSDKPDTWETPHLPVYPARALCLWLFVLLALLLLLECLWHSLRDPYIAGSCSLTDDLK